MTGPNPPGDPEGPEGSPSGDAPADDHHEPGLFSRPEEFRLALSELAGDRVLAYLETQTHPCYESELMREGFPEFTILSASPLQLFRRHFLLFHFLYGEQERLYRDHRYLHVHFMRTFLTGYPERGCCRFYEPLSGTFCADPLLSATEYCEFHRSQVGDAQLDLLSERFFYRDIRNFFALNEESARALLDGSLDVLGRRQEILNALSILDLPVSADQKTIRATFRELARRHHPDAGGDDEEAFKRINNAYHLLMRFFSPPAKKPFG
jgi:hypothetical protein